MRRIKLDYLAYFLDAYWNQMSDEVYGTIDRAVAAFREESEEYRIGLISDLKKASINGLLGDDFCDPAYRSSYWSQFQRHIDKRDAVVIQNLLEDS